MPSSEVRPSTIVFMTAVQSSQVLAEVRARRRAEEKMNAFMVEDWDVDCEWVRHMRHIKASVISGQEWEFDFCGTKIKVSMKH